jgi:signal recognition particle subunit SRP54
VTAGSGTGPDFTLEDFRQQLQQWRRMGLMSEVPADLPGIADTITGGEGTALSLRHVQGMIDAMTKQERDNPDVLDQPRCRRIAAGAGVRPQDVERFLRQFQRVRALMGQMAQMNIWREGGA